jgi:hypothetical protein
MKLKLPASICSPQDLEALLSEVREYAKWYSHAAVRQRLSLKQAVEQPTVSPAAAELLNERSAKKPLTQDSIDDLIADLHDFRDSAPRLTITLAAPAHGELKRTLAAWCRDNIEPNILVSFQFNSTLLGGMVVRYGSRIFDWSFRRQIVNQREKFPEALRNV